MPGAAGPLRLPAPALGLRQVVAVPCLGVGGAQVHLWPRPVLSGGRLTPGYVAVGRALLPGLRGTQLRIWVHGPAVLPDAAGASGPNVRLTLRHTGDKAHGAELVPWRLEVRAQRLFAPYEGAVRAGVGHQGRRHAVDVAFAGLDVELPPLLAPSMVATRKLRRSGFVVRAQLGRLRHGGLRPLLASRGPGGDGIRLRAVTHLWLRRMERPALDGRFTLDARWTLRTRARTLPLGHTWARAAWRTVRGGGTDRPTVRVGNWAPGGDGPQTPGHVLHEYILGHEDLARYANQVLATELGFLLRPSCNVRAGGFVSAALVQPAAGRRGRTLHAVGGIFQVAMPVRQLPLALTYQVARRAGSGHGAWLHLLTAGV